MAGVINPEKIYGGDWKDGEAYALDVHTVSSAFVGYDEYGHPQFHTEYSSIGKLLHNLKYNNDTRMADEIVALALPRLTNWRKNFSIVVPAPFSKPRKIQPVFLLAEKIAKALGKSYRADLLENTSKVQSKEQGGKKIVEIKATKNENISDNVLLVDDIFDTGKTLIECVKVLKGWYKVNTVYVLCITKTKNKIIRI